jgi:hypothetical protein
MSIEAQIVKYDRSEVDADLRNLVDEIADEANISDNLVSSDPIQRLTAVKEFVQRNAETIATQHAKMKSRVVELEALVDANVRMEAADEAYNQYVQGEEVQFVANMLAELRAMSAHYHQLLINTGRTGRPPF